MCKVLIVDDEKAIRKIFIKALKLIDIKCLGAESGMEALEILKHHPTVRVVVIDLHLHGMDGLTLCRKIKKHDKLMLTVALTGFGNLFTLVEAREAGFDNFFTKPISVELMQEIGKIGTDIIDRWQTYE